MPQEAYIVSKHYRTLGSRDVELVVLLSIWLYFVILLHAKAKQRFKQNFSAHQRAQSYIEVTPSFFPKKGFATYHTCPGTSAVTLTNRLLV